MCSTLARASLSPARTRSKRMAEMTDLQLFNSLTRKLETFEPVHPGEARVYTCGPTVYNYPHIGNMRAYVFADVLGRTLSWKGFKLTHVINITDVDDKLINKAHELGVEVKQVRLRSQSSRWGSCSSSGTINYNWRLILAPPHVLDYVAAHEVAHLVEMNHSPAFWATVARTLPDMDRGRAWLKAHGRELMAWQAPATRQ